MPDHNLSPGHLTSCQICGSSDLELIIDLGHHPPCDSLLTPQQLHEAERIYPLRMVRCPVRSLVQIDYVVPPEELFFPEYPYRSGITETLSRNLQNTGATLVEIMGLREGSLVIDLGSNDGTLLQGFKSMGMKVLGVEPTNIARIGLRTGFPPFGSSLRWRPREGSSRNTVRLWRSRRPICSLTSPGLAT